jgi:transposase InsO family protein
LLGIRMQRTDVHCPWQNGRIEQLFGTLKAALAKRARTIEGTLQSCAEAVSWPKTWSLRKQ